MSGTICLVIACLSILHSSALGAAEPTPGPGVDLEGKPVIDPTKNVLELVDAATKRQDDLRKANDDLVAEKIKRLDDLRSAESRRVDEEARLRAEFADKLALAEANRINAIRAVDVGAVAVANERNTQQATVLASQVTASAEALRNQVTASADALRNLVATTATSQAEQNRQQVSAITERLSALEKTQNESKGRSGVADPQLERLNSAVEKLLAAQSLGAGQTQAFGSAYGNGVTLIVALVSVAGFIFMLVTRKRAAQK